MHKHTDYAPLDNHAARPTLHTVGNLQTVHTVTHNNRHNLARYSRHTGLVQHGPTVVSAPPTTEEFYAMAIPYDNDVAMADMQELAHDGSVTIEGPSGITVVPKYKAKRYENSVRDSLPIKLPVAEMIFRMCLCVHSLNGATGILMKSRVWRVEGGLKALVWTAKLHSLNTVARAACTAIFGAKHAC